MTTLVVGVGYTGRRLLERLGANEAVGLSRSFESDRYRIGHVDLDGEPALPLQLPERYSVVYTVPPARTATIDIRLEKLLTLLDPAPARFVYLSTTGVYGNRDGALVDETANVNPESDRARRRVAAELLLNEWCAANRSTLVILRVPGIYGPGRLGIERIRDGAAVLNESSANPGNRIHVEDLVSTCVSALSSNVPGGVYNLGDGDERSSTWFSAEVARQAGLPAPPTISREQAAKEFSPMRLSFLAESRRIDTTKMRDVLGVTPRYPDAADGIRASLAEELDVPT